MSLIYVILTKKIAPVTLVLLAVVFTGCMNRSEEILVDEDGTTTITLEFSGNSRDFEPPVAIPTEPEWTILGKKYDSSNIDNINIELEAEKIVPYGSPLPESYADPDSPHQDINLHFPTSVRFWKEGNRTFYEFKRSYQARLYGYINLCESDLWDHELEDRVLEQGIFKVSEQDRVEYLDHLTMAFNLMHWRFLWETLGDMVLDNDISVTVKTEIEIRAAKQLESAITPLRILGILGNDDDSIAVAIDELEEEVYNYFVHIVSDVMEPDTDKAISIFEDQYRQVKFSYQVTESLDGQNFSVVLNLPGTVVSANGIVDPEEPGQVSWEFKGNHLHDKAVSLYALSVIEN